MLEVFVNDSKLDKQLNRNSTINDLIEKVLAEVATDDEIITEVKINDSKINIDEEDSLFKKKISSFDKIDFTLSTSAVLAFDALDSCSNYIDVTNEKLLQLAELYQANKINEANQLFSEVFEIIDLFVQLLTRIQKSLKQNFSSTFEKTEKMQSLEIHLLSVMKALLPAKEKNDYIMLCDLLEYELVDNLKQWKVNIIPELKKLKNS